MPEEWAPKKPNFGPPPPGYVAGLGRGATGFITRSDLGPAGVSGVAKVPEVKNIQASEVDDANYNDNKYDDWQGFKGPIFSKANLDDQDRQAEQAYDFCERRVFARREKQRLENERKLKEEHRVDTSINAKFVDLKRQLAKVSNQEWESIPDCIDLSVKKRKREKYTPVPDSLVMGLLGAKEGTTAVEADEGNAQDFREAKEVLLKSKLDNLENNVAGKSNIDKIGYITELNSNNLGAQFIGDVKRARMLLKSALASNPKNPDIWLSAARVQELDGKLNDCRQILRKAIDNCPMCEELWIELSRIQKNDQARNVLIEGLRHLPSSQKLWLYAARKEPTNQMKSKILRKGLENSPTSVKLWRELIEMESVEQAKNLLYKAVESLPKQIDLWLALAKIEDYKNAQKVLNKARKSNPLNLSIWISGARLQEAQSKVEHIADIGQKIQTILVKGREILKKNGANINRQEWIQQALYAQKSQSYLTCQMLVKISLSYGLTEEQVRNVLAKDVQFYEKERESNHTTRFLYHYGVLATKSKDLMKGMIEFENRKKMKKEHSELPRALKLANSVFESDSHFWKAVINELINEKNYESAIEVIDAAAIKINKSQTEEVLMLKVKIYKLMQQIDRARDELKHLRKEFPRGISALQSIKLQYQLQNYQEAWGLCEQHFKQNKNEEVWKIAFKIKQKIGNYGQAHAVIEKALTYYPQSLELWQILVDFQIKNNHPSKARAIIGKANQKISNSQELAIMEIQLERQFGQRKQAITAIAKALKLFPKNPEIWSIAVQLEPIATRKKKATSAIEVCGQHPLLNCAIAKLFWKEGKYDKAKKWFEEALKLNPNHGDVWAHYITFLQTHYKLDKEQIYRKFIQLPQQFEGRRWNRAKSQMGWRGQSKQIILDQLKTIIAKEIDSLQ